MQIDVRQPVSTIMTANPVTVKEVTLMNELEAIFQQASFHHVPVVDNHNVCVGVISHSDYLRLQHHLSLFNTNTSEIGNRHFFASLIVKDVMTSEVHTVEKDTPISEVIQTFLRNDFRSLVVVEAEVVIGIVTPYDILQALAE